jgi:hypothetical protein
MARVTGPHAQPLARLSNSDGLFEPLTRPMSFAIRIASRVLPTPPGPTRLTRRADKSILLSSASSWRRPTKLVASAGRLPEWCLGLAMLSRDYPAVEVLTVSTTHRIINSEDSGGAAQPQADRHGTGAIEPPSRGDICRPAPCSTNRTGVRGHRGGGRWPPTALLCLRQLSAISRGVARFRGHKPGLHSHRVDDIKQKELQIMIETRPTTNGQAPPTSRRLPSQPPAGAR